MGSSTERAGLALPLGEIRPLRQQRTEDYSIETSSAISKSSMFALIDWQNIHQMSQAFCAFQLLEGTNPADTIFKARPRSEQSSSLASGGAFSTRRSMDI